MEEFVGGYGAEWEWSVLDGRESVEPDWVEGVDGVGVSWWQLWWDLSNVPALSRSSCSEAPGLAIGEFDCAYNVLFPHKKQCNIWDSATLYSTAFRYPSGRYGRLAVLEARIRCACSHGIEAVPS